MSNVTVSYHLSIVRPAPVIGKNSSSDKLVMSHNGPQVLRFSTKAFFLKQLCTVLTQPTCKINWFYNPHLQIWLYFFAFLKASADMQIVMSVGIGALLVKHVRAEVGSWLWTLLFGWKYKICIKMHFPLMSFYLTGWWFISKMRTK